jgi:hypothetical protein
MDHDLPDAMEDKVRDGIQAASPEPGQMQESDNGPEYGSEDARTLDPTLQQHITGAQPDPQRQTDERLGETTTRNRRVQKEPEKSRRVTSKPFMIKRNRSVSGCYLSPNVERR